MATEKNRNRMEVLEKDIAEAQKFSQLMAKALEIYAERVRALEETLDQAVALALGTILEKEKDPKEALKGIRRLYY